MIGELAILNVGAGDTKLTFDPSNRDEMNRAATIVSDMLRRGFVLLIEDGRDDKGPIYRRALDFDPKTAEYIVAGSGIDLPEETIDVQKPSSPPQKVRKTSSRRTTTRIPAAKARGTAVSRTSGG